MSPPSLLTRTFYFANELLLHADFIREQQYVRDLVAMQNQALVSAGIASGMSVKKKDDVTVTISAGIAFRGDGRPIVLLADMDAVPNGGSGKKALHKNGDFHLLIAYADDIGTYPRQTKTVTETPAVTLAPVADAQPANTVILGKVTLDASGNITSVDTGAQSGRQTATLLLAGQGGTPEAMAEQAEPATSLAIGPALDAGAAPLDAPLTVGVDYAAPGDVQAVASFAFADDGGAAGTVSIGPRPTAAACDLLALSYAGVRVMSIDRDGAVHTLSDAKATTDVAPIVDALTTVRALTGVSFSSTAGGRRRLGLLARDVEKILPDLVRRDADLGSIVYAELIGVLVEAVKSLADRVDALERQRPPATVEV